MITSFADSPVDSRYRTLASAEGIRFSIDTVTRLELPASAVGDPNYASRAPTATPGTSSSLPPTGSPPTTAQPTTGATS